MKAVRYIVCILLILVCIGLLAYQHFVEKNLEGKDLTRAALIILGAVLSMVRKPKHKVISPKATYEKAYSAFVQNAFHDDAKLEKRLYTAIHFYNLNKPEKAIAKLKKLRCEFRILLAVFVEHLFPLALGLLAGGNDLLAHCLNFVGYIEGLFIGPVKELLGCSDVVFAQRFAVSGSLALLVGAAVADLGLADDDGGLFGLLLGLSDSGGDSVGVVAVVYLDYLPAVCEEALGNIFGESDVGAAFDGDVVVIIEHDELAEL